MSDSNQISLKQGPGSGAGGKAGGDSAAVSSQKPHPLSTPENGATPQDCSRGKVGAAAEVDALRGSPAHMGEGPRSKAVKEEETVLEVGGAPIK